MQFSCAGIRTIHFQSVTLALSHEAQVSVPPPYSLYSLYSLYSNICRKPSKRRRWWWWRSRWRRRRRGAARCRRPPWSSPSWWSRLRSRRRGRCRFPDWTPSRAGRGPRFRCPSAARSRRGRRAQQRDGDEWLTPEIDLKQKFRNWVTEVRCLGTFLFLNPRLLSFFRIKLYG